MAGKKKEYDEKKLKYTFYLNPDSIQLFDRIAKQHQTSFSALLEQAIIEYLQEVYNEKTTETKKDYIFKPDQSRPVYDP